MKITRKAFLTGTMACVIAFGVSSTAMADELEDIQEAGVMRIAMSGAYPPFNFVNEENQVVGFDVDIGTEIAKRMGVEVEVITTAWDGIIAGLMANKYDAIVGSMTITEERDKVVDFVGPYYSDQRGVFVKNGSDITSVEQLVDVKVGVTLGETHEEWAQEQGYDIKTYKGLPELLIELDQGRVDAIVNDSIAALIAFKDNGYDFVQLEDLETERFGAGIAIRPNNPDLAAAMQSALDEIMEDGTYEDIAMNWIGADIR